MLTSRTQLARARVSQTRISFAYGRGASIRLRCHDELAMEGRREETGDVTSRWPDPTTIRNIVVEGFKSISPQTGSLPRELLRQGEPNEK